MPAATANGDHAGTSTRQDRRGRRGFVALSLQGSNILVAEDDDGLRTAIERLLHSAGMPCVVYPSAEALLEAGEAVRAACVISDQRLPLMSGLELLAELRSRGALAPLILITAHDSPALRAQAAREGVRACLAKPFRGTALLDEVRAALEHGTVPP
jgi:FixJ family two-component response regulator